MIIRIKKGVLAVRDDHWIHSSVDIERQRWQTLTAKEGIMIIMIMIIMIMIMIMILMIKII